MQSQKQSSPSQDNQDLLLREYQSLVSQIIHWDTHFWRKSQFFLVIESAFVAIIIQAIREFVMAQNRIPPQLIYLLFFVGIFNIYLCYVWFRTNRRNREYLRLRFERARQIESEFGGTIRTFTYDTEKLPKCHGSADWEIHLATGFMVVWVVLMVSVAVLTL